MSKPRSPTSAHDTRARILDAAWERFVQYGFGKTTMAEVAQDCDMSAANLYRFFESKQDIGAALACRCLEEKEQRLRVVVEQPGWSAAKRLHVFALEIFDYMYNQSRGNPRINELVQAISQERADIVVQHKQAIQALIAQILIQGKRNKEFAVKDVAATAEAIQATLVIFTMPYAIHWYTREEFEILARDVVNLIVQGIAKH